MVKEAAWQLVENFYDNWESVLFYDLYAASGQMAIEAISRGCTSAFAIEINRSRVQHIRTFASRENINELNVHQADALRFLKKPLPAGFETLLVYADPPYSEKDPYLKILKLFIAHCNSSDQIQRAMLLVQAPHKKYQPVTAHSEEISYNAIYTYRKQQLLSYKYSQI